MASSNGKPAPEGEGKTAAEGSIGGYESLHRLLEANLSPELFKVPSSLSFLGAQIRFSCLASPSSVPGTITVRAEWSAALEFVDGSVNFVNDCGAPDL
jgi:hypothetical protein